MRSGSGDIQPVSSSDCTFLSAWNLWGWWHCYKLPPWWKPFQHPTSAVFNQNHQRHYLWAAMCRRCGAALSHIWRPSKKHLHHKRGIHAIWVGHKRQKDWSSISTRASASCLFVVLSVWGKTLNNIHQFAYLGSILTDNLDSSLEIQNRGNLESASFGTFLVASSIIGISHYQLK